MNAMAAESTITDVAEPHGERKALVVDDFSNMRGIIKSLLRQVGFENIDEAEDGVHALNMLKSGQGYCLIISDWSMPNMGGIELLEKVRQDPELKAIPFIIMTEAADKKKIMEAIRAGADNFVIKPFTIEAMKWSIKKITEKKKLYRQAGRNLLFQDT